MSQISEPQTHTHVDPPEDWDVVIIGAGAAGMFAAICCAEQQPGIRIRVLERAHQPLGKVRISGGGRCNVTHACFDPEQLIQHYPRGGPWLKSAFKHFQPKDMIAFFEARGVELKQEADGRIFPRTDRSETIVRCLLETSASVGVVLSLSCGVVSLERREEGGFCVRTTRGQRLHAQRVLLATGGGEGGMRLAASLGHTLVAPVPSLFALVLEPGVLTGLAGVSLPKVRLSLEGVEPRLSVEGALLITHQGISGPAALRLSAWGARALHARGYRAVVRLNSVPDLGPDGLRLALEAQRQTSGGRQVQAHPLFQLPERLWEKLIQYADIPVGTRWAELAKNRMRALAEALGQLPLDVQGRSVHKEEFVTAGGVPLSEVAVARMESRVCPGLHVAGEVLDVDGVTGGFNFQNAWTSGYLAGRALASGVKASP